MPHGREPTRPRGCGGLNVNGTTLQWVRRRKVLDDYRADMLQRHGIEPELVLPKQRSNMTNHERFKERWGMTVAMLASVASPRQLTLLDVGGIGRYRTSAMRYTCINVDWSGTDCSIYERGAPLPYGDSTFDVVLAESTLHHAAEHTVPLLQEMVRVSRSHLLLIEDVLERTASQDVLDAYRKHDQYAVYRSLHEWLALTRLVGPTLRRLAVLHRVQVHVAAWATDCDLDFAPMVYMLFQKGDGSARNASAGGRGGERRADRKVVRDWLATRRCEERRAGMRCKCTATRCAKCRPKEPPIPRGAPGWNCADDRGVAPAVR